MRAAQKMPDSFDGPCLPVDERFIRTNKARISWAEQRHLRTCSGLTRGQLSNRADHRRRPLPQGCLKSLDERRAKRNVESLLLKDVAGINPFINAVNRNTAAKIHVMILPEKGIGTAIGGQGGWMKIDRSPPGQCENVLAQQQSAGCNANEIRVEVIDELQHFSGAGRRREIRDAAATGEVARHAGSSQPIVLTLTGIRARRIDHAGQRASIGHCK